ncbi:MAG TPA: SpoIID/LytB domain-containing protein, partial [Mycobacteriales bacterium]|nr:SpoIID/LytB domain-containing protein [Mycobacteriales bacterium]
MRRLVLPLLAAPLLVALLPSAASAAVPTSPGPDVVVAGSGWGHSVGMSQYGARAMAQAGRSAEQILTHYYPGVAVRSDVGPGEGAIVSVHLFRHRTITTAPDRVLLMGKSRDGGPAAISLRTAAGDVPLDPARAPYNVSFQAGTYVVRASDGTEVARTPQPVHTVGNDGTAMVALPQLGATLEAGNRSGMFAWGTVEVVQGGSGVVPVLRQEMGEYLKGIAEMPSSWEPAALQAQAVAARTYAARFDGQTISATPVNQAYSGWAKEGEPTFGARWVAAVRDTAGRKVVAPDGSLAQTFYSSSHGLGRSEASSASWAYGSSFSYLRSVDDPWSLAEGSGNPYRSWLAKADNAGFAGVVGLARVNSVRVVSRSEGGSPLELDVDGWRSDGVRTTVRWKGAYSASDGRGAGSRLRLALPLKEGGASGRLRSQQISAITLAPFTDDEDS